MTQNQEIKATVIAMLDKIKLILIERNNKNELDIYIQQCDKDLREIRTNQNVKLENLNVYNLGIMYVENRGGDWENDALLKLMFDASDFIGKASGMTYENNID